MHSEGVDYDTDFGLWSMSQLRQRVEVVRSFDRACDNMRDTLIEMAQTCKVTVEQYTVKKERLVARCAYAD